MFLRIFLLCAVFFAFAMSGEPVGIHRGWQIAGSSNSLESMDDFNRTYIDIVWFYDDKTDQWRAFSADYTIKTLIQNSGFNKLSKVPAHKGFWILSEKSGILDMNTTENNSSLHLTPGWQLIGSSIGSDDLSEFNNSKIESVWTYKDSGWEAYLKKGAKDLDNLGIKSLHKIKTNEGFWIKVLDDTTISFSDTVELNETESPASPTDDAYDYNFDNTAILKLKQKSCNNWKMDIELSSTDPEANKQYFENYLSSALDKNLNQYPIYAPQGKAGDFNISISNGTIDLTNYKLPGDINGDGKVDDTDAQMLILALAMSPLASTSFCI